MAEQTAVEYLFKQYKLTGDISNSQWDKAERMHEEQVIDFGKKCQMVHDVEYGDGAVTFLFTPEELYEQTYKTQVQ